MATSLGVCLSLSSLCAYAQDLAGVKHLGTVHLKTTGLKPSELKHKRNYIPRQTTGIILPYKSDALNDRQPLVLVHGIGGTEGSRLSEWDNFLKYTDKLPEFQKRFKIYLFHYDSAESVQTLSKLLAQELAQLMAQNNLSESDGKDSKKVKILAYSEGGLLTRNALQAAEVNRNVAQVITIATPFHGSPLASREWFCDQLEQGSVFDPIRISRKIAYWVAQKKHPYFEDDFHWDNIDNIIGDRDAAPAQTPAPKRYALESKTNFITYGSFFGTPNAVDQQMVNSLSLKIPIPVEKIKLHTGKAFIFNLVNHTFANIGKLASKSIAVAANKKEPTLSPEEGSNAAAHKDVIQEASNISESHTLLSLANETIQNESQQQEVIKSGAANLQNSEDPSSEKPETSASQTSSISSISMMPFNDGISPISSSLWLGRFTPQFKDDLSSPSKRLWAALRSLKGTDKARLFAGMDHKNWIEGENRTNANALPDLLNPQDKPKSVFAWLVSDLMQDAAPLQTTSTN
ncbi:MAG: hypothetical protein VKJ04_00620 [Vampirovibrionales bacterium]|nr:hypothetical protein [Vampirovibrionales bacterium]